MNNVYSGVCLRNLEEDFVRDVPELQNDDLDFSRIRRKRHYVQQVGSIC